ncbi:MULTISPECIES: hypothetical protein [Nocardia]|uniref:hypothetical protein n=1 Tax=Nocardia TaxID=1817 RepID=UPI000A8C3F7E|nr:MULTISPECIES: hypothetical protein [Nocardia]
MGSPPTDSSANPYLNDPLWTTLAAADRQRKQKEVPPTASAPTSSSPSSANSKNLSDADRRKLETLGIMPRTSPSAPPAFGGLPDALTIVNNGGLKDSQPLLLPSGASVESHSQTVDPDTTRTTTTTTYHGQTYSTFQTKQHVDLGNGKSNDYVFGPDDQLTGFTVRSGGITHAYVPQYDSRGERIPGRYVQEGSDPAWFAQVSVDATGRPKVTEIPSLKQQQALDAYMTGGASGTLPGELDQNRRSDPLVQALLNPHGTPLSPNELAAAEDALSKRQQNTDYHPGAFERFSNKYTQAIEQTAKGPAALFGLAGHGAPSVADAWKGLGKQVEIGVLLGAGALGGDPIGGYELANSGNVPGLNKGETRQILAGTAKGLTGWDDFARGDVAGGIGTIVGNIVGGAAVGVVTDGAGSALGATARASGLADAASAAAQATIDRVGNLTDRLPRRDVAPPTRDPRFGPGTPHRDQPWDTRGGQTPPAPDESGGALPSVASNTERPGSRGTPSQNGGGFAFAEDATPDAIEAYERIANSPGDVPSAARNTGLDERIVEEAWQNLFVREHTVVRGPDEVEVGRFTPNKSYSDLWDQASRGELDKGSEGYYQFRSLIAHEYVESKLMELGLQYMSTAPEAWGEFGPSLSLDHPGAHLLAPRSTQSSPDADLLSHWKRHGLEPPEDGIVPDLSNLDEVVRRALNGIPRSALRAPRDGSHGQARSIALDVSVNVRRREVENVQPPQIADFDAMIMGVRSSIYTVRRLFAPGVPLTKVPRRRRSVDQSLRVNITQKPIVRGCDMSGERLSESTYLSHVRL